jgi:methylglutaconyl-CoA hydratase
MSESVLTIDQSGEAVAIITLNRPERRNALTIELMDSLRHALDQFAARMRVVILRGAGPAFCSGLDLVEAADAEVAERSAMCVARTFRTVCESPLVTIAAVHGAAYAGGAGLMACCDFVVAEDGLKICFPEVRRGLVPALAAAVSRRRLRDGDLRELVLLAEPIDAQRALEMRLVDRVVPGDKLMEEAEAIAASVLKGAPHAIRHTKHLLGQLDPIDREQLFGQALRSHTQARHSDEAREGLAAFHERREPNWPKAGQE